MSAIRGERRQGKWPIAVLALWGGVALAEQRGKDFVPGSLPGAISTPAIASMQELPAPIFARPTELEYPGKKLLHVCYPVDQLIKDGCKTFREKMQGCGFSVVGLDSPSVDELERVAALLPPSVPAFVDGHGIEFNQRYFVVTSQGKGIRPQTFGFRWPDPTKRADVVTMAAVRKALDRHGNRPKWFSTCHSGGVCEPDVPCVGAACAPSQKAVADRPGFLDGSLDEIGLLLCDAGKFHRASRGDGVLTSGELNRYLCEEGSGGRLLASKTFVVPLLNKRDFDRTEPLAYDQMLDPDGNYNAVMEEELRSMRSRSDLAGMDVALVRRGIVFRAAYTDNQGKRDFLPLSSVFHPDRESAEKDFASLREQLVATGATEIDLQSVGQVYRVEARDPTQACFRWSGSDREQDPQFHNFVLLDPNRSGTVTARVPEVKPLDPRTQRTH
jgi:hypothetical protein